MKRKLSIILSIILIVSMSTVMFNGCGKKAEGNQLNKIAAILPLTGNLSKIGLPKKNAMEIAVNQINKNIPNDKDKLSIVFEDSKGTPKDGQSAFQKYLSTTNIKYYYIDLTPIVNAVAPIIDKEKVVTFAGSAQPEVTNLSKWIFRLFAGGDQEIELLVKNLIDNKVKSVYVLHSNEIYGSTAFELLKKLYEKEGGAVKGRDDYPLDIKDAKNIIVKAKNSNAEKIVVLGYGVEFPVLLKQMKELNIPRTKLLMNLGATNATVIALGDDYTDDITFVGPKFAYMLETNSLTKEMQNFVDEYKKVYGQAPDFRAAYAYDTIMILYSIWQKYGFIDLDKVSAELVKIKDYDGVSGKITFKANGDSNTDLVLAQYKNGKMILLK